MGSRLPEVMMDLRNFRFGIATLALSALCRPALLQAQSFWTDSDARKAVTLEVQTPVFRSSDYKKRFGLVSFLGLRWPLSKKTTFLGELATARSTTSYSYPNYPYPDQSNAMFGNPLIGLAIHPDSTMRFEIRFWLPLAAGSENDGIEAIPDVERFAAFASGAVVPSVRAIVPAYNRKSGYGIRFTVGIESWIATNSRKFGESFESPFWLLRYGVQLSQRLGPHHALAGISGIFYINEFTFA